MNCFRLFFVCMLGMLVAGVASVALGQVGADPALAVEAVELTLIDKLLGWIVTGVPVLVMVCSGIAAFIPSTNKLMAIVDVFALNWNKARNDPAAQKWGG